MNFFVHLEVKGLENLKGIKGNVILACNHAGEVDPIIPPISIPYFSHLSPMFYVSREKKFYGDSGWRRHLYGGLFFEAWGSYQVFTGLRDYDKALVNHIRILNDGGTVCIFPEGRTTPNGQIQAAKGGVAYLSYITKVPIIPVRLHGTFRLSLGQFLMRKRKITIIFGKPIHVTSKTGSPIPIGEFKERANFIMNVIRDMV